MLKFVILTVLVSYDYASAVTTTGRVGNGNDAEAEEFPYIVSLRYFNSHTCGASILDETHVLTAAQCVAKRTAASLSIQYGVTKISSSDNIIKIKTVSYHENYNPLQSYANDIAVLELASALTYNEFVQPVTLPEQDELPPTDEASVFAGWGYAETAGSIMESLQKVDLLIYSYETCRKAYWSRLNSEYHLCSGVAEGGKGICSGDFGGPLIADGKQIGIASWTAMPCGIKGYPGVFCPVSKYVNWINEKKSIVP